MKKYFLLLAALISLAASAQKPSKVLIFNVATMSADTATKVKAIGKPAKTDTRTVQYIFEDMDCDDNFFDVAIGQDPGAPSYPATSGEVSFPVALDSTATRDAPNAGQLLFCRYPLNGECTYNFSINIPGDAYYLFETFCKGSCTTGKIYRVR